MDYFEVKNWEDFQHYTDRTPPWIKLYNHLLDDYEFSCLQDASKLHLILIWLLASRNSNKLPIDPAWIRKRIGVDSEVDLIALFEAGFIVECEGNTKTYIECLQVDSAMLADRKQVACLEERESRGEREQSRAEGEGEGEKNNRRISRKDLAVQAFDFWVTTFSKTDGTKFTKKRGDKVLARLKEGYTIDQIKHAIVGCSCSAFHQGENDSQTVYDDLELICRSGEKLESFWKFAEPDPQNPGEWVGAKTKQEREHEEFMQSDWTADDPFAIEDQFEKVINP